MFGFLKSLLGSKATNDYSEESLERILQAAMGQMDSGDVAGGLKVVMEPVERLRGQTAGPLLAKALFNASIAFLSNQQLDRAITLLEEASEIRGADHDSGKDRLSYLMNLGEVLTMAGRVHEAEQQLRIGLAGRKEFYPQDHPGIAFGLQPLAVNLLTQNRAEEALPLIDEAIRINAAAGQLEAAQDMAIRGLTVKALQGSEGEAFAFWDTLSPELQEALVEHLAMRSEMATDEQMQGFILLAISELVQRDLKSLNRENRMNLYVFMNNIAKQLGEHDARSDATARLLEAAECEDNLELIVDALQAKALAESDQGDYDACEQTYVDSLHRAKQAQDAELTSRTLRNLGLFYSELEELTKAKEALAESVEVSASSSDPNSHGRSLVAYGIFLQHQSEMDEARDVLEQGVGKLPLAHPDRFCGMSHLIALREGMPCSCDESSGSQAIGKIVEEIVRQSLPDGLLKSISFDEGISVEVEREPTREEAQMLHQLIDAAMGQLRSGAQKMGY